MIRSFRSKDSQSLFEGNCPRKFEPIKSVAERKLQMLDAACSLSDLLVPPANRLEKLRGDRKGQWSIRINDRWRICFQFEGDDAFEVEIVDYHS